MSKLREKHKTFIFSSKLLSQDYWPPENECTATARGGISPTAIVSVSDMQGSFFTLLIGIVMSFIVLGGELCCCRPPSTPKSTREGFCPSGHTTLLETST